MTIKESIDFIEAIRAAGGDEETVVKVVTKQGAVKAIVGVQVFSVTGHPLLKIG